MLEHCSVFVQTVLKATATINCCIVVGIGAMGSTSIHVHQITMTSANKQKNKQIFYKYFLV